MLEGVRSIDEASSEDRGNLCAMARGVAVESDNIGEKCSNEELVGIGRRKRGAKCCCGAKGKKRCGRGEVRVSEGV